MPQIIQEELFGVMNVIGRLMLHILMKDVHHVMEQVKRINVLLRK